MPGQPYLTAEPLEEAIRVVTTEFPAERLRAWATLPEEEARTDAHFGLGVWVRNHLVYGEGAVLPREIHLHYRAVHADEISDMVITALWRSLNGYPCPTVEELIRLPHLRRGEGTTAP